MYQVHSERNGVSGFVLVELLMVCLIISILATFLVEALKTVMQRAKQAECSSRLRQVGQAYNEYKGEYRRYPCGALPEGFGDLANWQDLWGHIDPFGVMVFKTSVGGDGIVDGNRTIHPRVPRRMETYVGDVRVLHCTEQGASNWWYDVGPYWYYTNSPFVAGSGPTGVWVPYAEIKSEFGTYPLSACQSPDEVMFGNATWRHGTKQNRSPGGLNNHLFAGGNVCSVVNPEDWTSTD